MTDAAPDPPPKRDEPGCLSAAFALAMIGGMIWGVVSCVNTSPQKAPPTIPSVPAKRHPQDTSSLHLQVIIEFPLGGSGIVWIDERASIDGTNYLLKHSHDRGAVRQVMRFEACEVANGTSADLLQLGDNGATVNVVAGPHAGCHGFVPSYSLNTSRLKQQLDHTP